MWFLKLDLDGLRCDDDGALVFFENVLDLGLHHDEGLYNSADPIQL